MIAPSAIDHICLTVTSLEKTQQYFAKLFDFSFQPRQNDPNTLVVESENIHFFISQIVNAPSDFLRLQHISFRVASLEAVIARLDAAGITGYTTGAVDFFTHNNYRWCEWRDPNGIRLECVELTENSGKL